MKNIFIALRFSMWVVINWPIYLMLFSANLHWTTSTLKTITYLKFRLFSALWNFWVWKLMEILWSWSKDKLLTKVLLLLWTIWETSIQEILLSDLIITLPATNKFNLKKKWKSTVDGRLLWRNQISLLPQNWFFLVKRRIKNGKFLRSSKNLMKALSGECLK